MKKVFLAFAVIATMGIVSCGTKAAEEAPAAEEAAVVEEVVEAPCDSCAEVCDSCAAAPAEEAPAAEAPAEA